ncbi:energy-converting hydrogenase Eha subunit B [Bradyrhizobium sp. F1.13.1]
MTGGVVLASALAVFLVGLFGGAVAELVHWYGLRTNPRFPEYWSSIKYWTITVAMILVAGIFTWLNFGSQAQALTAFQIGLLTPLILQKAIASAAGGETARSPRANVTDFLRG